MINSITITHFAKRALRRIRRELNRLFVSDPSNKAPPTAKERALNFIRVQKPLTKILGPLHGRNPYVVEIDLTYNCNLRCKNCNRSCGQAPSEEQMSLHQIERFLQESFKQAAHWEDIRLLGGEPALHQDLLVIIDKLLEYRKTASRPGTITLLTNGAGQQVQNVLKQVPDGVIISNSGKKEEQAGGYAWYVGDKQEEFFIDFNDAPADHWFNYFVDYVNGCWIPVRHGIGLNPYGYYCCSCAAAMDRVFGFDMGRKTMPQADDLMLEQRRVFCRMCGHFTGRQVLRSAGATVSPLWRKAYERYNKGEVAKLTSYAD